MRDQARPIADMSLHRLTQLSLRDERGITLLELLTAATLTVLVVGGMGMLVVRALHQQPRIADRAHNIEAGRQMVERMTRELREGADVTVATASQVTLRTYVRSTTCGAGTQLAADQAAIECRVTYSCSGGTCSRQEFALTATSGTAVEMVTDLVSDSVFAYTPSSTDPQHVTVTLVYPSEEGDEGITISDGAGLRNTG